MSGMEIASLVASIASVVVAVVAIWLSVVFYRMSSQISESTREAAKGIGSSVDRLEKLFDKLYSDTFSMMRDTVSDMRKHIWPEDARSEEKIDEEAEKKAEAKLTSLRQDVQQQLSDVLKRQRLTDERVTATTHELGALVERAMARSRQVELEAREETIREHILRGIQLLRRREPVVTAGALVNRLGNRFPGSLLIEELQRMRAENLIAYKGEAIGPETEIELQ